MPTSANDQNSEYIERLASRVVESVRAGYLFVREQREYISSRFEVLDKIATDLTKDRRFSVVSVIHHFDRPVYQTDIDIEYYSADVPVLDFDRLVATPTTIQKEEISSVSMILIEEGKKKRRFSFEE